MLFSIKSLLYGTLLALCYAIKIVAVTRLTRATWTKKVNPRDTFMLCMNILGGLMMVTTVCLKETVPDLVGCNGLVVVAYLFQAMFYLPLIVISIKFWIIGRLFIKRNMHIGLDLSQTNVHYHNLHGKMKFLLKNSFYRFVYVVLVASELAVFVFLNDNSSMITRQTMDESPNPDNYNSTVIETGEENQLGFCFDLYTYIPLIVIGMVYTFLMSVLMCSLRNEFTKYDDRVSVVNALAIWLLTGVAFFCYDLAPLPPKVYQIIPGSLIIVFQIVLSDWILYIKGYKQKRENDAFDMDQFEMVVMTPVAISSLLKTPGCQRQVMEVLGRKASDQQISVASFIVQCMEDQNNSAGRKSTVFFAYANVVELLEEKYPGSKATDSVDQLGETQESVDRFIRLAATYLDENCNYLLAEPELQRLIQSLSQSNAERIVIEETQ